MQHHHVLVCRPRLFLLFPLFSSSLSLPLVLVTYCCPSIKIACPHLWNSPLLRPGDAHSSTAFALVSPSLHLGSSIQHQRAYLEASYERNQQSVRLAESSPREKETVSQLKPHAFPLPEGSFTNQPERHPAFGRQEEGKKKDSVKQRQERKRKLKSLPV